jgi:hypothetical protein
MSAMPRTRTIAKTGQERGSAGLVSVNYALSEKQFMQQVIRLARLQHWSVYHVYDARRSTEGFPDGWFVREGVLLVREFKTETGRVTPAQQWWLAALAACGLDAKVWRPSDWAQIQEVLM